MGSKPGGNLVVNASDSVEVIGTSADSSQPTRLTTQTSGNGIAATLTIATKKLVIKDGGLISSSATLRNSQGTGGIITIRALDSVELMGERIRETPEKTFQSRLVTGTFGDGSAGDLNITTGKLIIQDGGQVFAGTQAGSKGPGGNLTVTADSIEVIGTSSDRTQVSRITNQTSGDGSTKALTINTRNLSVRDGGLISTATVPRTYTPNNLTLRQAGSLNINASDSVEVIGTSADVEKPSLLTTRTSGNGTAGALTIITKKLIVKNGGEISTVATSANSNGTAGNLTIRASSSIELMGETIRETPLKTFQSRLTTDTIGNGRAGDLNITTGKLIIQDGGQVFAGTQGGSKGPGGNLTVTADSIEVIGTSSDRTEVSRITNQTRGDGDAKTLTITSQKLSVRDGGLISSGAVSRTGDPNNLTLGQGGNLNINASESVEVRGGLPNDNDPQEIFKRSRLTTTTEGKGKAGDLTITTGKLIILDGGQVSAGTIFFSQGQGGDLTVNASDSVQVIGESLYGEEIYSRLTNRTAGVAGAGNSTINTPKLIVRVSSTRHSTARY